MPAASKLAMTTVLRGGALTLALVASAQAALAQSHVVVERWNVRTAPGLYSSAIIANSGGPPQTILLGERGLTRAIYWDDDALIGWAQATFGVRATIEAPSDIPEPLD